MCVAVSLLAGMAASCATPVPETTITDLSPGRAQVAESTTPIAFPPLRYTCQWTPSPPAFDGLLNQGAWADAPWTRDFGDIEGPIKDAPYYRTRAKMLWDAKYFYFAAVLEETDLWATYDTRDMIVFHENDIEVFIDPDGDGREYYEIEINVIGTIFDLYLHRPYREGGPAEHGWDTANMVTSIKTFGTVNDPSDRDKGWIVEFAVPWSDFVPPRHRADGGPWTVAPIKEHLRRGAPPSPGDVWRVNFSRVQWDLKVEDGVYRKVEGAPEYNWTWTPQWEINMHVPEHWGYVEFVAERAEKAMQK